MAKIFVSREGESLEALNAFFSLNLLKRMDFVRAGINMILTYGIVKQVPVLK